MNTPIPDAIAQAEAALATSPPIDPDELLTIRREDLQRWVDSLDGSKPGDAMSRTIECSRAILEGRAALTSRDQQLK